MPPAFPPMTLTIMRAMCALTVMHPGKEGQEVLCKALDKLFEAYWVNCQNTSEKDVLTEVLESVLGKEEAGKGKHFIFFFIWLTGVCYLFLMLFFPAFDVKVKF